MRNMSLWLLCLVILAGAPVAISENVVRIGGGSSTGEYIHVARAICNAIGQFFTCHAIETGGTLDNIKKLETQHVEFGLAMANVASEWLDDPATAANYTIIRRIVGEAVLVFGKPDTIAAVGSWIGVRENAALISIGVAGELSGDAFLLRALRDISGSPLANLVVKTYPNYMSLIEGVKKAEVKLGFFVQVPNPNNALFTSIAEADLQIMGVIDPDMVLFDEIFSIGTVTVKNASWFGIAGRAQRVETSIVPMAIIAVKPEILSERTAVVQQAVIKRIVALPTYELLPQNSGWIQELSNTITLTVGKGLDNVMSVMKSLAVGATERIKRL